MTKAQNLPLRGAAPSGTPTAYTSKELITSLLRGTDPGAVSRSGQGYVDFAQTYDQLMVRLRKFAGDLAEAWKGPSAGQAQQRLREVFEAAHQISTQSTAVGNAIKGHGSSYLSWYRQNMPTPKTVQEAQQWMQGANERITQTWSAIPPAISTTLPMERRDERGTPVGEPAGTAGGSTSPALGAPSGDGGGAGARSGAAGPGHRPDASPLNGDGRSQPSAGGHPSPGSSEPLPLAQGHVDGQPGHGYSGPSDPELAGLGGVGGTHLAGFDPAAGAGTGPIPGSPGQAFGVPGSGSGSFTGGGPGSLPFGGGYGPGATGNPALPSSGFAGPGTGVGPGLGYGTVRGGLGSNPSSGPGAAGTTGRPGTPGAAGVPGHPAGGKERERERRTWLAEDKALWEEGVEVAPRVIGEISQAPASEAAATPSEGEEDPAVLLRAALDRIAELEARNAEKPPASEPPIET
jgi:hypothetical protein